MSRVKILGGAGVLIATALIGGTLIGSVLGAASTSPSSDTEALPQIGDGAYCDVFLEAFAAELGVDRAALAPAARVAATAALDAAVEAGDVNEERAERIRERIAEADGDICERLAGGPGRHGGPRHDRHHALYELSEVAASELGIERSELIDRLRDGETLEEIATAQGVDFEALTATLLDAARAELDEAVAAGMLSQEAADRIMERLEAAIAEGRLRP